MIIRRATTGDAARLADVGARLFAQAFAAQNTQGNLGAYLASAFNEPQQRRELSDASNLMWIAEENAAPVGYAHVKLGSAPATMDIARPVELARMYADQHWHGRGVGAQLLQTCVDAATEWGATALWLGVWKENPRGIAFYQKHGFRIAGEQVFQIGSDPQHDWIMVRDLAPADDQE